MHCEWMGNEFPYLRGKDTWTAVQFLVKIVGNRWLPSVSNYKFMWRILIVFVIHMLRYVHGYSFYSVQYVRAHDTFKKTILIHACIICHKITYSPVATAQRHTVHSPLLYLYIHTKNAVDCGSFPESFRHWKAIVNGLECTWYWIVCVDSWHGGRQLLLSINMSDALFTPESLYEPQAPNCISYTTKYPKFYHSW